MPKLGTEEAQQVTQDQNLGLDQAVAESSLATAVTILCLSLFPVCRAGMRVVLPSLGRYKDYRDRARAAPLRGSRARSV